MQVNSYKINGVVSSQTMDGKEYVCIFCRRTAVLLEEHRRMRKM